MIDSYCRKYVEKPIGFCARYLVKFKVSANMLTLFGLLFAIFGSVLYYLDIINYSLLVVILICGIIDILDGKVANLTTKTSFGAFLDIVVDRIVEFIFLFVIASKIGDYFYFFILFGIFFISIAVFLTSAVISNNSTTNKSFYYSTGVTERTETFIFISLLVLFSGYYKLIIIIFICLVIITILQRMYEVYMIYGNQD